MLDYTRSLILDSSQSTPLWTVISLPVIANTVLDLCKTKENQKSLLPMLTELIPNSSNKLRSSLTTIFGVVIAVLDTNDIAQKIIPILVNLKEGADGEVKQKLLQALGNVVVYIKDSQLLDKVTPQFEVLINENNHDLNMQLLRVFVDIVPKPSAQPTYRDTVTYTPQQLFRDTFMLPQVVLMNKRNNDNQNVDRRAELTLRLFDVYQAIITNELSKDAITKYVIPGMTYLLDDSKLLKDSNYKTEILKTLQSLEQAVGTSTIREPSTNLLKSTSSMFSGINLNLGSKNFFNTSMGISTKK